MEYRMLWENGAPGFEESFGQLQPAVKPFLLDDGKKHGCVIVCPGGGYQMLCDYEGDPICERINTLGIHAFTLRYRVTPYHHPMPLMDIQRAIRYVRFHADEFNVLPDKIAVLGFSAGGHLVCTAATIYDRGNPEAEDPIERVSCRPDAFVPCYAVTGMHSWTHQGSLAALTGMEMPPTSLRKELTSFMRVTADTPPAFIWHTAPDEVVPVECSLHLAEALSAYSVKFTMHIFPEGPHGISLGDGYPMAPHWPELMGEFLQTLGF